MKPFLCLLCLTPVTVILAVAPIAYTLLQHVLLATATSRSNSWATNSWWNWYGSWIFFGGPFGRWIWGTVLGFHILKASRVNAYGLPGMVVEQPHLRVVAMAMPAMILSLFCLVRHEICQSVYWQLTFQALAVMTIRSIFRGNTTIETLSSSTYRPGSRPASFICIPNSSYPKEIKTSKPISPAHPILPGERIYDLGQRANWNIFWRTPLWHKQEDQNSR